MSKRDLLFIALCLSGLALLGKGLLSSQRQGPLQRRAERLSNVQSERHWSNLTDVVQRADEAFRLHWKTQGLQPTPTAPIQQRLRRVSLALTGSIPSLEELRTLEQVAPEQRMQWWIDHLLRDPRTADHVAERLTRAYVGTENGPFLLYRRSRFREWLSEQFADNRPYDALVRELIAGDGLWTTSPAVNFLTVTMEENDDGTPDPIRLAGRTSRAFLGMRIDCLQCHDDKMSQVEFGTADDPRSGKQDDFHQLAAFFCDAKVSMLGLHDGEGSEHQFERPGESTPETAPATPPYLPEALSDAGSRRDQLAAWVTSPDNKPFARATVNRMWALAYGRPLVEPIDDIPYIKPLGGYPPGLTLLADDFRNHGFDLHRLLRIIMSLEPFQRDSRDPQRTVTKEQMGNWAAFPLTRMRPDQMASSVLQSCSLETLDNQRHFIVQLQTFGGKNDFIRRYGDTGEDEFVESPGTLPQRLVMMNGKLIRERTGEKELLNAAARIAALAADGEQAVTIAYRCVLSRDPAPAELEHFAARIDDAPQRQRGKCLADLYWVLLNSTEFNWNH